MRNALRSVRSVVVVFCSTSPSSFWALDKLIWLFLFMIVKYSQLRLDLFNFEHPILYIEYIVQYIFNIFNTKYTIFPQSSQYNVDCENSHNLFAFFIRPSVDFIDFRALYDLFDKYMACENHFVSFVKCIA